MAPLRVTHDAALVDADAVREGLTIRLGDAVQDWTIEVLGTEPQRVQVRLQRPDGTLIEREVSLQGTTVEERSRELTAAVVVVFDSEAQPDPAPTEPEPVAEVPASASPGPDRRVSGIVGVAGRVALSRPSDIEGGAEIYGGAFALREILHPWAEVGWARSTLGALEVDGVRFGAGLALGAPLLRGRLWVGGGASARAVWASARAQRRGSSWGSSTFVGAILHGRLDRLPSGPPLVLTARTGVDLAAPALRFASDEQSLRWGNPRFAASVGIAFAFPFRPAQ